MADTIKIVLTIDDSQMSVATQRVGANLRTIQTAMQRTADSTQAIDRHFNGLSGKFRDLIIVGGLLRFAMYDIRDVFSATIGKVIESSAQIERMTILMKGLSTATSEQAKQLDAIQGREFVFSLAKNAPFEVNALTDSFVKMKAAGLDPMDGKLQTLVDSVAKFGGSSEQLKRASVAIQQMSGKGVISMEELRQQLGEAIPTAMQDMADGAGVSMAQLVRSISKGEVESKTALERMFFVMRVRNGDSAKGFVDTWLGQMEKLKTNFTLFGNQVGEGGFYDGITKSLKNLNVFLESNSGKKFASDIGQALVSTMQAVQTGIQFVIRYGEEIKTVGQALVLIWGGQVAYKGITGLSSALSAYIQRANATLASERSIQATKLILDREMVASKNQANVAMLASDRANALARVELFSQAAAAEMAISLRRNQAALAAQRSLDSGLTTRGTPVNVARATATMASQRALAVAAQESARQFAASQATMAASANAASAAIITANARTATSLTAMGTAARAGAVAMGIASRSIAFLGGPLGILAIALTAGALLWDKWGAKAKQAIAGAEEALTALKGGYASFENVSQLSTSIKADTDAAAKLTKELEGMNALKKSGFDVDQAGINAKAQELLTTKARIEKNRSALSSVETQAISNSAKDYVTQVTRASEIKIDAMELNARSELAKETALIRENAKNKDEAAIAVRKATIEASKKMADSAIKIYTDQNKAIEKTLASGVDSSGKALKARAINDYKTLVDANRKLISAQEDFKKQGEDAFEGLVYQPKTDPKSTSGAGDVINSKIKNAIDALKARNAELKAEAQNLDGNLASIQEKLDNGDFNSKGKKGAVIKPTKAEEQELIDLTKQNTILIEAKEQAAYIERVAGEAGQAFDSLTNAWVDGQAKYKAALDNFESDTKTSSTADEKMIAGFEEKRLALKNYLETSQQSAENATVAMKLFNDTANETVNNNRGAKALELAQSMKKQAEDLELSLIQNSTERAKAEGAIRLRNLDEQYQAQLVLLANNLEAQQKLTEQYNRLRVATEIDTARKSETPMQQMGREWRDVTTQMQNASTGWANQTIDEFMKLALTGKASFTDLTESILTDILRMKMQEQLSGVLTGVFGALEDFVGTKIGGIGNGNNPQVIDESGAMKSQSLLSKGMEYLTNMIKGTSTQAGVLTDSLGQTAVEGVVQAAKSSTAAGALSYVANAANAAANALNQIAVNGGSGGGDGGGSGFLGGIFDAIGGFFGGSDSVVPLPDFVPAFAKGGIMSSDGAVSLRKYANGGIANSPQLALYGEGSMNEAYVPLPDGRSIPVTMTGGGNSNVVVNVINNASGTEATQTETKNSDGSTSIDVIIQQVEGKISQNISKGRGSLSGVMEKTYGLNRATGSYR